MDRSIICPFLFRLMRLMIACEDRWAREAVERSRSRSGVEPVRDSRFSVLVNGSNRMNESIVDAEKKAGKNKK